MRSLTDIFVHDRVTSLTTRVVERVTWWGAPTWYGGHLSAGIAETGTEWLAIGRGGWGSPVDAPPGTSPPQIVVDRSSYSDSDGVWWSAGTSAPAVRLR